MLNRFDEQNDHNAEYLGMLRNVLIYNADAWRQEVRGFSLFAGSRIKHPASQKNQETISLPRGVRDMIQYLQKEKIANLAFSGYFQGSEKHLEALCKIAYQQGMKHSRFRTDPTADLYRSLIALTNASDLPKGTPAADVKLIENKITKESIAVMSAKYEAMRSPDLRPKVV